MKLTSFRLNGKDTYGTAADRGVTDLGARLGTKYPDLKALIAHNGYAEAKAIADKAGIDAALDAIAFLPVIPNPGKIFCIGLNYEEHRVETQREKTANPTVFLRVAESQVGHGQPMLCPRESTHFSIAFSRALDVLKHFER